MELGDLEDSEGRVHLASTKFSHSFKMLNTYLEVAAPSAIKLRLEHL